MGDQKGERAERLPLHSEHRLRRAQDINRKQLPLYSAGIAGGLAELLTALNTDDPHVALQLELQRAFGLRMREAALLKIHAADKDAYLAVNWGTKGGRDRVIPIETDYQRDVLHRAKALITHKSHSLILENYNFKQWKNHYYYVCHQHGISRKDGVTSHGLRHERLNEIYHHITGQLSPIKNQDHQKVNHALDQLARQEVAEVAGHSRLSIANAYIGKHS